MPKNVSAMGKTKKRESPSGSAAAPLSAVSAVAPVAPVFLARLFGWSMLAVLAAFLFNNVLKIAWGFPPLSAALEGDGRAFAMLAVYAAFLCLGGAAAMRHRQTSLRRDAQLIGDFNIYLVRAFFWAVLLVGIVDATIAFLRVEKVLPILFEDWLARELGRARFVGPFIHIPLVIAGFVLAAFTRTLGFIWLAVLIVAAELLIVISRFVFSYEQALMGDLVRYWYAALFLFASAYTLLEDGHVRVDVLYAGFERAKKGLVNAWGAILLGLSTCWTIILIGFGGKQSIINSPVANMEVSQTGGTGMFIKYQMAAFLGIFAITMFIQFISSFFDSIADYRREAEGERSV